MYMRDFKKKLRLTRFKCKKFINDFVKISRVMKSIMSEINRYRVGVVALLIIPLIIVLVFYLPADIKTVLKFDLSSFNILTLYTIYTAIFIHQNFNHLLGNIIVYYLSAVLSYILSILSRSEKWLIKSHLLLFLIIPPLTHFSLILRYGNIPARSYGFSGIASGILGLSQVSVLVLLNKSGVINKDGVRKLASIILLINVLLIFCRYQQFLPYIYQQSYLILIPVFLLTVIIINIYMLSKEIASQNLTLREITCFALSCILILFTFICIVLCVFPIEVVTEFGRRDIVAHYIGLILGFCLSFLLFKN